MERGGGVEEKERFCCQANLSAVSLEIQYNSLRRSLYAINTYEIDAMRRPNCSFIMK